MIIKKTVTLYQCPYCHHVWVGKTLNPTGCPKCHNKLIKKAKILKRVTVKAEV